MPSLCIDTLHSGGLVVNYVCSSACAHCSYRSSPRRDKSYITYERALANCRTVRRLGCRSMHIGGGEPFLNREGLKLALQAARDAGVGIDYIETNSSWYRTPEDAAALLRELRSLGCDTLLVSIDPFHNEFIPFAKVKGVLAACRRSGMGVFPWLMEFYDEIDGLDDSVPHSLDDYATAYGEGYVRELWRRYSPSMSGRAASRLLPYLPPRPTEDILGRMPTHGRDLANTGHFHIDLYGSYLPTGYPGIAIAGDDLGSPLPGERYRAVSALYDGGVPGLADLARRGYGFTLRETYRHPAELSEHVRRHLAVGFSEEFPDLGPAEYYTTDSPESAP